MEITIRKSVRPELAKKIPNLCQESINWMQKKYPTVNFDNVGFIFSASYKRSRYFRNEAGNAKYLLPNVCVTTRATLYLYDKRSLGLKKTSVYTGSEPQIMCSLIHELTHHAQYEQKIRMGNELDTTANELAYLKEYHPKYYSKLVK